MNKTLLLTKTLFINSFALKSKKQLLIVLVLIVCFLPTAWMFYEFFGFIFETFNPLNLKSYGLTLGLMTSNFFLIFITIFTIPSYFFFSKDNQIVLGLPLTAREIGISKMILGMVQSFGAYLIVFIPIVLAFITKTNASILNSCLLVILGLISALYSYGLITLLTLLLMRFSSIFKNKEKITNILMVLVLTFSFSFSTFMQKSIMLTPDQLISFINSHEQIIYTCYILPYLGLLNSIIFNHSLLALALFIGCGVIIMMGLNYYFDHYLTKELAAFNPSTSKKKVAITKLTKKSRVSSKFYACIKKEVVTLFHTPPYFQNCILISYLLPTLVIVTLIFDQGSRDEILKATTQIDFNLAFLACFGLALGFLMSNFNMIASTSISRLGDKVYLLKLYPVSIQTQLHAYVWVAIFFSITSLILLIPIIVYMFGFNFIEIIIISISALLTTIVGNYLGIIIDLYHPYLTWTTEVNAVKQNINSIIMFFVSLSLGGIMIALLFTWDIPIYIILSIYLLITFIIGLGVWWFFKRKAYQLLSKILN